MVTTADIDMQLAHLRDASAQAESSLVDVEDDPTKQLLEHATLTGETKARWAAAVVEIADLWRRCSELTEIVAEAEELRRKLGLGRQRHQQLADLLFGPSVVLATDAVSLQDRGLFGPATRTMRCTPDDLLETMATWFGDITRLIASVAGTWDGGLARVAAARSTFNDARALGTSIDADAETASRIDRSLQDVGERLLSDPLGLPAEEIDAVESEVVAYRTSVETAVRLRDRFDDEIAGARATLDGVLAEFRTARRLHEELTAKIASDEAGDPPSFDNDLAAELDDIVATGRAGCWGEASDRLMEWIGRMQMSRCAAADHCAACNLVLDQRNQLRGRLDAYQAKAVTLGLAERPELAALYEHAHELLYTAPTDLVEATEAIGRHQATLARLAAANGAGR
jgi:hypothetical protein